MKSSSPSTIREATSRLLLISLAALPLVGCSEDGNPAQNSIAIPKDTRSNIPGSDVPSTKKGPVMKDVKDVAAQAREKHQGEAGATP